MVANILSIFNLSQRFQVSNQLENIIMCELVWLVLHFLFSAGSKGTTKSLQDAPKSL